MTRPLAAAAAAAALALGAAAPAVAQTPPRPAPEDVVIGVVDTGINPAHQEFAPDQVVGWWDWTNRSARPEEGQHWDLRKRPFDGHGHGTLTAAMAAGRNVGPQTTKSFAPGTKLAIAKVVTDGGLVSGDIGAAVRWLTDELHADVINISIGTIVPVPGAPLHFWASDYDALEHARASGVLVTVANGNGTGNLGLVPGTGPNSNYGASLHTLAVGASGTRGAQVSYDPEVAAQYSITGPDNEGTDRYIESGGTSFASPLVGGFAAKLLLEARTAGRPLPVDRLELLVKYAARDTELPPTWEGYGVLDAAQLAGASAHARAGTLPGRPSPDPSRVYVETAAGGQKALNNGRVPAIGPAGRATGRRAKLGRARLRVR